MTSQNTLPQPQSTSPQNNFSGQTVYVVGASHGIGEGIAKAFAATGADVVIAGRSKERLDQAAERIGFPVRTHEMDANSLTDAAGLFASATTIDHLVLATGGGMAGLGALADLGDEALQTAFTKVFSHLRLIKAAAPKMAKTGSVTFIGAGSSRAAFAGTVGLAAANGAIDASVPPLAIELAPVRVNAVAPGIIDTPWWNPMPAADKSAFFEAAAATTPVGRIGRVEDIAEAVLFLAGNGFSTGTVLEVTGGGTLATGR